MNLKLKQSDTFTDKLETFPKNLQDVILGKMKKLENNPGYPSLHTKKLNGQIGLFESRVNKSIRVLWQYDGEKILLLNIGYHDILKDY